MPITEPSLPQNSTIVRYYSGFAVLLLNTFVVFVLVNVLVFAVYWVADRFWPARNEVADKYGSAALIDIYPDLDQRSVDALLDETWSRSNKFEPYVMFREPVTHGTYVNVHEAGFRLSRDQAPWPPATDAYNVFLFGGSTTFSYGLPDGQSLASFLQEALATAMRRDVAVYNFGAGGYQSTQERILFEELLVKGQRPSLAIFVDGLNEFAFPHVPMSTGELRRMLEDTPVRRLLWLSGAVVSRLPIARLVGGGGADDRALLDVEGTDADSEARRQELFDGVVTRYLSNKRLIEAAAKQFGIRSVFIWQPIPYYKYDNTYHPFFSAANRHAQRGYEHIRRVIDGQEMGPNFVWAADMQEHVKERLYVDSAHYTARMTERLARYIVERMAERRLF